MKAIYFSILIFILAINPIIAQGNQGFGLRTMPEQDKNNVVMTWNKDTPETAMNDDIKGFADYGVTIKYSNLKRNDKGEIIRLSVSYSDKNGSEGKMDLKSTNPINTIKIYKQDNEIGFGEPTNSNQLFGNNEMFGNLGQMNNMQDLMKQFNFNFKEGDLKGQMNESMPQIEKMFKSDSKIIIQKDGKQPLVIENGEVTKGGEDYTKEEIDEIKKNNKVESFDFNGSKFNSDKDLDTTKEEMLKAKEEMIKAREELEKAKKELEKSKSTLKTRKV